MFGGVHAKKEGNCNAKDHVTYLPYPIIRLKSYIPQPHLFFHSV